MPYHLKRKGDDYFVVDDSGKKYSSHGLDKATARKQMTALNIAHARKEGYNIPPRDPSPTCNRRGTLKGNIGELHPELKAMFADKAENAFIEKLYSKFKALEKAPPKMEVVSKEVAEVKPKKKELEVESKEIAEVKPKKKELEVESREIAEVEPVKKVRKIKVVKEEVVEMPVSMLKSKNPDERFAYVRSMDNEKWNKSTQAQRRKMYNVLQENAVKVDEAPSMMRRAYKQFLNKE